MILMPASPGQAAEDIFINIDEAHPPFMYDKDSRPAGIYPALIGAVFKRLQIQVRFEPKPWARAVQETDSGLAGLAGVYKNSERIRKWDFSEPLLVERIFVFSHSSRPVACNSIDDLKGKLIGVMRGWSYGDTFDTARRAGVFQTEEVGTDSQNFQKLAMGRLDALLAIPESVTELTSQYTSIHPSKTPLVEAPSFLAFAKTANRQNLLEKFNQILAEMKASGEFEIITDTYLSR